MRVTSLRARLLAVAGLVAPAPAVFAADAPVVAAPVFAPVVAGGCDACASAPVATTYGPVFGGITGLGGAAGNGIGLFAPNPPRNHKRAMIDGQQQPACAVNSFPLSDWAYIRRYCGPTIIPGTCYGHFQTKWRKWEDHCPQGAVGCGTPAAIAEPVYQSAPLSIAPPSVPVNSTPLAPPTPVPMPMKDPEKDKEKTQLPKFISPDVAGMKTPTIATPNALLAAPVLPDIPTPIPTVPERGR